MDENAPALILEPYLFLGPVEAASPGAVLMNGITHVLTIGGTRPPRDPDDLNHVVYRRIPLANRPTSIVNESSLADEFIDSARASNGKILVHCRAGMSRSPSIVAAYLMKRYNMSLKQALGMCIRARPRVNPNPVLLELLKEMEMSLRGVCSLDVVALPAKRGERLALFGIPAA
ncbi:hypothetical protein CVT26_001910 [Gymnopilus dilepis]|uniref:protein-tyrosine-phosphatase n=1 Tax=Gymnopilus dilepis TaxID=231916 RepID=A0A409Y3Z3_9AGAR|nr:hypothetical protein CVT26_001910 [Gymnopilus dilepis]